MQEVNIEHVKYCFKGVPGYRVIMDASGVVVSVSKPIEMEKLKEVIDNAIARDLYFHLFPKYEGKEFSGFKFFISNKAK